MESTHTAHSSITHVVWPITGIESGNCWQYLDPVCLGHPDPDTDLVKKNGIRILSPQTDPFKSTFLEDNIV